MSIKLCSRAAMTIIAAILLSSSLSGCTTTALDVPKPVPREEPINSLALEQCIGENGQENCASGDE